MYISLNSMIILSFLLLYKRSNNKNKIWHSYRAQHVKPMIEFTNGVKRRRDNKGKWVKRTKNSIQLYSALINFVKVVTIITLGIKAPVKKKKNKWETLAQTFLRHWRHLGDNFLPFDAIVFVKPSYQTLKRDFSRLQWRTRTSQLRELLTFGWLSWLTNVSTSVKRHCVHFLNVCFLVCVRRQHILPQ